MGHVQKKEAEENVTEHLQQRTKMLEKWKETKSCDDDAPSRE